MDDHPARHTSASHRLSASDALLWDIELDPVLRSTITAVAVLDRAPDWAGLVRRIELATRTIPRLRQRVVEPTLGFDRPRWDVVPDLDLDYHLRRAEVRPPGTMRELLEFVQPIAAAPFDRSRPLWEFTLVEGLEGDRAAFVQKIHHTVTDGVGGIELAMSILDERRNAPDPTGPPVPEEATPGAIGRAATMLLGTGRTLARNGAALPIAAVRTGIDVTLHPIGAIGRAGAMASSVAKMVAPVPRSSSPILLDRSLGRRFDTIDLPLAGLKEAATAADCTANDALLAAVVEGIRRYHLRHDAAVPELRITMPISLRHDDDEPGGNHFAPARFAVPTDIDDPVERMRRLGEIARRWQSEPALPSSDIIAAVLDTFPAAVTTAIFGSMLKHVDAVVTNVRGIPTRTYLAGAELLREYAFAPPVGAAINIALVSHVHTACIGVVSDTAAVTDHDQLLECLVEGFDDVLSIAGAHARRSS